MLSNSIAHVSTSQTGSQPQNQSNVLQQATPSHEGRQSDQVVSISPKMPKERKEGPNGDVTFANQNATYARGKFHSICLWEESLCDQQWIIRQSSNSSYH